MANCTFSLVLFIKRKQLLLKCHEDATAATQAQRSEVRGQRSGGGTQGFSRGGLTVLQL